MTAQQTLYHLTSWYRMESIWREGRIRTTESNIHQDGSGPRVVWLTDDPTPSQGWQSVLPAGDPRLALIDTKDSVRITVALPEGVAQHWPAWSRRRGIPEWWYAVLAKSGGDPTRWWVVARPIPRREIVRIEDLRKIATGGQPRVIYPVGTQPDQTGTIET